MKYLLIGVFLCFLSVSCQEQALITPHRYNSFPEEKTITAREITLDSAIFRYPFRVAIKDEVAIVMDLHGYNHYFQLFSYPQWKHLASFGKRGEAPGEMLSAEMLRFISLDSIYTLDANKMQITRWAVSPEQQCVSLEETIPLDRRLVRSLDCQVTDSGFLITDYLGEHRFHQVSANGHLISSTGIIPSESIRQVSIRPALAQAWRSFTAYNPRNGIYALVTQLGETIELYNLKEQTHTVLRGPDGEPIFKVAKGDGIPTGIMGFSDVHVTDKYIYTVFHGTTFRDKINAYRKGKHMEDGGRSVYVFTLDGQPVRHYRLDYPVYGIDVNEATNTLIATCVEKDNPILQYTL